MVGNQTENHGKATENSVNHWSSSSEPASLLASVAVNRNLPTVCGAMMQNKTTKCCLAIENVCECTRNHTLRRVRPGYLRNAPPGQTNIIMVDHTLSRMRPNFPRTLRRGSEVITLMQCYALPLLAVIERWSTTRQLG